MVRVHTAPIFAAVVSAFSTTFAKENIHEYYY